MLFIYQNVFHLKQIQQQNSPPNIKNIKQIKYQHVLVIHESHTYVIIDRCLNWSVPPLKPP